VSKKTRPAAGFKRLQIEDFRITEEPFYLPVADEVELFETAYAQQIPVLLKGPTGCGKTRFIEHMSWRLHRHDGRREEEGVPLITVACHEDLTASDLVGRYLLEGDETRWIDGPIARAVKVGAICYLDEIVEARKDTTVLIHPLADYRRLLPVEKRGELLEAAEGFLLVLSYNPGYQSALKDLKHSTRQRFIAIEFDYPSREQEARIVATESGCERSVALDLAKLAEREADRAGHPSPARLPRRDRVGPERRPRAAALHRRGRELGLRAMSSSSSRELGPRAMSSVFEP
jgi:nitric oxide reductase NorQ protein